MATDEDKSKLFQIVDSLYNCSATYPDSAFKTVDEAISFLEPFNGLNPGLNFSLACMKDYRNEMKYLKSIKKLTRYNKSTLNHKLKLIADHAAVINLDKYEV